jgi:ribA/ribD-fused uncharacterized protein
MSNIVIDSFKEEFAFLSNFYPSVIYIDGKRYASVEHAYQAAKTDDPVAKEEIRTASTAGIAKKLGKHVSLRKDWESVKIDVMRQLLMQKFEDKLLRSMLIATEDARLVEGNYWGDTCWGVCNGRGENWLGRLLMEVRESIKV